MAEEGRSKPLARSNRRSADRIWSSVRPKPFPYHAQVTAAVDKIKARELTLYQRPAGLVVGGPRYDVSVRSVDQGVAFGGASE